MQTKAWASESPITFDVGRPYRTSYDHLHWFQGLGKYESSVDVYTPLQRP